MSTMVFLWPVNRVSPYLVNLGGEDSPRKFKGRSVLRMHHTFGGEASPPHTVRAEIITELIPARAGPVIFKIFLLELIAVSLPGRFQ